MFSVQITVSKYTTELKGVLTRFSKIIVVWPHLQKLHRKSMNAPCKQELYGYLLSQLCREFKCTHLPYFNARFDNEKALHKLGAAFSDCCQNTYTSYFAASLAIDKTLTHHKHRKPKSKQNSDKNVFVQFRNNLW